MMELLSAERFHFSTKQFFREIMCPENYIIYNKKAEHILENNKIM